MKKLHLLIFWVIPFSIIAQGFAPQGAIWHYSPKNPFYNTGITYTTIESVSEIVIDEVTCKKLIEVQRHDNDTFLVIEHYMFQENDRIFFYKDGAFHLLYDFGADAGDTLILDYFLTVGGYPLKMVIDSTAIININGWDKKLQYITCGDGVNVEFGDKVIEGIGSTYFMFPVYDGAVYGYLRCYEDDAIGLFQSPYHPNYWWNFEHCSEIITNISEIENILEITVYPNPSSGIISISGVDMHVEYFIYNIYGKALLSHEILSASNKINTEMLSSGIYILKLIFHVNDKEQIVKSTKIIIKR